MAIYDTSKEGHTEAEAWDVSSTITINKTKLSGLIATDSRSTPQEVEEEEEERKHDLQATAQKICMQQ